MELILTILSVLGAWAFLTVLLIALLLVLKVLDSIKVYMEKIAMGVRAIEQETKPLASQAGTLADSIVAADQVVGNVADGLAQVNLDLGAAADTLGSAK